MVIGDNGSSCVYDQIWNEIHLTLFFHFSVHKSQLKHNEIKYEIEKRKEKKIWPNQFTKNIYDHNMKKKSRLSL